jgi:hypothetical protein
VTLHHADWTTLDLGRTFAIVYNPIGSFSLLDDADDARRALIAWRQHVAPGGSLVLAVGGPAAAGDGDWTWRVRRSGTRAADGVTFMVHEAIGPRPEPGVEVNLQRHEVWEPDGSLRTTFVRRHRLRFWSRDQLADLLRDAGFADVSTPGDDAGYLAIGHA